MHKLLAIIALVINVHDASAQSGSYISGIALADIKQFDSVEYDPRVLALGSVDSSLNGTAAGGGIRVGTFLHPKWSLELGVEAESQTRKNFPNPYELLPTRSSTLRLPETSQSTTFVTVNTVVGFHPPKAGRVQLGYLGGFSFVRGTYRSTTPDFGILPAGFTSSFTFTGSSGPAFTSIAPVILPPPNLIARTLRRTDMAAGGLLGFEAAIDLTSRLTIVPGVRTIVFSNLGQSAFLIRPEVGARWAF
jgi:hypothetical protein